MKLKTKIKILLAVLFSIGIANHYYIFAGIAAGLFIALSDSISFGVYNKYHKNDYITDPSYSCLEGNLFHDSLCK